MTAILPAWWIGAVVLLWGAVWGSFANVVIARLPEGKSVAYPASHCPACETPIRWYDNLPIISWLILRGRCRHCNAQISIRYPLVEFGGIVCAVAAAWAVGGGPSFWRVHDSPPWEVASAWMLLSFFFLILLMLTLIDLKHLLLPHRLTIALTLLAFVYAFVVPPGGDWRGFVPSPSIRSAAIGFAAAYGGLLVFSMGYTLLRGRQGMGGGDFMLFGALGAWFGIEALPMLMLLAAFQGVLLYLIAMIFFPSLIHEISDDDAEFWAGRTGDPSNDSAVDAELRSAPTTTPPPSKAEGDMDAYVPQDIELVDEHGRRKSAHDASETPDADESSSRGVAFGPLLCLAAVEFVAFGGMYFRWLYGGV